MKCPLRCPYPLLHRRAVRDHRGEVRAPSRRSAPASVPSPSDGRPYVEPFPLESRPPGGAGTRLAPWPNRTAGGRRAWHGTPQQLALNEPAAGNAIHGLLRYTFYDVADRAADTIPWRARVAPQPGWPVPLATQVRYAVAADGLTVTHTVTNVGDRLPFGVGAHPYVRVGDTPPTTARCSSPPPRRSRSRAACRTGPANPSRGTPTSATAAPSRGVTLDDAFGGCVPAHGDELVRHRLIGPDGGVEVGPSPAFAWVQVFTPDDHPGRGRAVAVEPMTCPPDALNSGTGLITIDRRESWQGSWGLRPI